jgi:hypothetical protein
MISIGNAFAIGVSFLLKIAVGIAYIQYLWKTLRKSSLSLQTINDAFGINSNIFSFLNWELVSTVRIGTLLAIVLWYEPTHFSSFSATELNDILGQCH